VLAVLLRRYRIASAPERRAMTTPALAATALCGVLATGALARILDHPADGPVLVIYQVVLVVAPVALYADAWRGRWSAAAIDRLAVELGDAVERTPLRDRLATVLGDPSLVIGYPAPGGGLVDESGRRLDPSGTGPERTVTAIRDAERVVAVLVHDRAVLDDPQLLDSVARLTSIVLANMQLHAEAQAAVEQLESSRSRLLTAADAEREHLVAEVDAGALARLRRIDALLPGDADHAELRGQLQDCAAALADFARGVHPHTLTEQGLNAALVELVASAPLPITLDVGSLAPTTDAVNAAAYFVCAEALTNIARYAQAASAAIQVRSDGAALRVDVVDDGAGGADPAAGSGLRGLADRLDVLGGVLIVHSPPGGGTRVTGLIPLGSLRRPAPTRVAGNAD
jgi:signal transduction histidine kinase